ncbi:hypothetical protein [Amycolatopsis sp. DSM 110486]|uniref:hypothetical protein n=1 Tax=Amycolatopsis sp. DSM 110486 TaxID=2865832 RepID=UPI001C698FAF|nr:hypothetical protein [Amycolatopsis sp. DSM 110486]QYN23369.1 hypothetical protein K1T34_13485 [Amycolatopsis sp. DSM 110486]
MKVTRRVFAAGVAAATITVLAPAAGAMAAPAGPIELAPRAGDTYTGIEAINDRGTVVGESYPRETRILYHPMKWSTTGEATALPTLGGALGQAVAVNQADVVVGVADDGQGAQRAARWAADGTVTELATSGVGGGADAISDTGRIVGSSYDGTFPTRCCGSATAPSASCPACPAAARRGPTRSRLTVAVVAGTADDAGGDTHVVRWDERGRITDLTPEGEYGRVVGISRDGTITGSITIGGNPVAKRWDPSGRVVTLGGTERRARGTRRGSATTAPSSGSSTRTSAAATRRDGTVRAARRTCRATPATRPPTPSTAPARSWVRPRASARSGRRTALARGWNRCRATLPRRRC